MQTLLYIAGDMHLRSDAAPFAAWLDWLAAQPPASLILLGDCFEYWIDDARSVERYRSVLERLRALRAAGWDTVLVLGNRELAAGRRLEAASGCRCVWPHVQGRLPSGMRYRVIHGDRLSDDPAYHCMAVMLRGFWMRTLRHLVPAGLQHALAGILRRRSRGTGGRARQGHSPAAQIAPWRLAAQWRHAELVIAGHIHARWQFRHAGKQLVLVGDWPGERGAWLELTASGAWQRRSWPEDARARASS